MNISNDFIERLEKQINSDIILFNKAKAKEKRSNQLLSNNKLLMEFIENNFKNNGEYRDLESEISDLLSLGDFVRDDIKIKIQGLINLKNETCKLFKMDSEIDNLFKDNVIKLFYNLYNEQQLLNIKKNNCDDEIKKCEFVLQERLEYLKEQYKKNKKNQLNAQKVIDKLQQERDFIIESKMLDNDLDADNYFDNDELNVNIENNKNYEIYNQKLEKYIIDIESKLNITNSIVKKEKKSAKKVIKKNEVSKKKNSKKTSQKTEEKNNADKNSYFGITKKDFDNMTIEEQINYLENYIQKEQGSEKGMDAQIMRAELIEKFNQKNMKTNEVETKEIEPLKADNEEVEKIIEDTIEAETTKTPEVIDNMELVNEHIKPKNNEMPPSITNPNGLNINKSDENYELRKAWYERLQSIGSPTVKPLPLNEKHKVVKIAQANSNIASSLFEKIKNGTLFIKNKKVQVIENDETDKVIIDPSLIPVDNKIDSSFNEVKKDDIENIIEKQSSDKADVVNVPNTEAENRRILGLSLHNYYENGGKEAVINRLEELKAVNPTVYDDLTEEQKSFLEIGEGKGIK